ncbi:hypothetical protein ACN27F_12250 [Solwaraspora sp. WMMB335]|uniref:hypothetical protein n=1 Tax=Solwaraspora sp. WMMB335 TaxID=3404118 RepID=UPI003B962191
MEIISIPELSTLPAACAPMVGGYLTTTAPTGLPTGPNQHQHQAQVQRRASGAWLRHRGAAVVATSGVNSSQGSVRTTIPAVKKPFMDAARGVPPRGRPV